MGQFADQFGDEDLTELGDSAVYTPHGGSAVNITVLFEEHYEKVSMHGEQAVSSIVLMVLCKRSLVPNVGTKGDTVAIDGTTFYVTAVEPAGNLVRLILSEDNVNE